MTRRSRSPSNADVAKDSGKSWFADTHRFRVLNLPAGRRVLPTWLVDADVRWMFGWGNRPDIELCFSRDPLADIRFTKDVSSGDAWLGANPEGNCFQTHWHSGLPRPTTFERHVGFDTPDGKWARGAKAVKESYVMLATHADEGYAGRSFDIVMADDSPLWPGETVRLRGPWHHGSGRPDCVDVVGVVWDDNTRARYRSGGWRGATKSFGYVVHQQTLIDALATFLPHCPIAEIEAAPDARGKIRRWIEPCVPQTGRPRFMTDDQRVESFA